jgi:glycosyltransferase involved in cell wall biosynthesis/GT2 family glycosyltransferase
MKPPLRLIITGMHRSGTSFIASLFAAWNVPIGEGDDEDVELLTLNRRILAACTPPEDGHRDWGWTESGTFDSSLLPTYRDSAAALSAARDRTGTAWGWKDPRTSLLLDFWDDVLGREARFLFLYRHPWEVADSMLRTGAGVWLEHPDYPSRIWTHYNQRLLDFHRRHRDRTLLVSTNRLLRDPEAFIAMVRERLGIDADAETLASLRAEDAFVSFPDDDPLPGLWQHTNAEAMNLLGELDDEADLGNHRRWETASRTNTPPFAERPRLSVIIPCYNDGDYVIDAVASVKRNAPAAELIVVDDGSTQPRTREVLAALRQAGHRVIEQPHEGLSSARNAGIAASAGDYFLPLDADNRLLPGFATEAVALLDADSAAGVVYGDRREFGARRGNVTVPELDLPRMLSSNYIDACAVVRRAVWSEAGGYDVAFHDWEDWDFWLGAAARGWRFVRIPRPTFEYRVRPDSLQQRFLRRADYLPPLRRIYEKYPELVSAHAKETLIAAHVERRKLLDEAMALRVSRDAIQLEIDRLALGTREQLTARDAELASVKFVLQARDEEVSALRNLQPADRPAEALAATEPPLTGATEIFTIVARNYLAYARVLAASLTRHNPNSRLQVVVLDDPDRSISSEPSFDIIHVDELPFDPSSDLYTMAATYDVTELATAVKPWAFEHLFARGASVVIYLDPDIEVFDSLGPLEPLTRAHGMVLTPHVTEPLPQDGKRPEDRDMLLSGIYNLGFLALSAQGARAFLPWWRERLRRNCLNDIAHGLFVDQRWIDFAPALFEPAILKDPGYNVAYWNLPHRALTLDGDRILVNADGGRRPLRFFHYSGFSPRLPHLLSKHQLASPRIRLSDASLVGDLCRRYAAALEANGFAECDAVPYGFATTATQLPLDARARRCLPRTYVEDEASEGATSFPNPFSKAGADDVIQRLLRPSPHSPAVPAYLGEIWSERADLRVAFPNIDSTDAERFLDWVRTQGVREHPIPPALIPPRAPRPSVQMERSRKLTPGVNVYGYAYSESGTGQIVRAVVAALAAEGIPYAVVPFTRTVSRQQREFRDFGAAVPSFDTNLLCINADPLPLFFEEMRGHLPLGARNVGLWAWEVEDLPAVMARSESYLDEVWGISSFTAAALSRSLTKPVRAFPLPVVVPEVRPRTRAELGMPEGFLFLFCFDYDSVFRRKNPLAVVAAFRQAFADRPEVVLYIKTTNAERHAREDEELRTSAAGRPNIVIRDGYVSSDDYFSMLDACDCYVSLHRSEGFGLTVAEAMALGKPVISTAYSSTLEFANESNSFLVPIRLTEVGDDAPPYPPRSRWAEPDVADAAEHMARVYADPGAAAAVGARARADIQALHSPRARGPLLRRLLDEHRLSPMEVEMTFEPPGSFEMDAFAAESLLRSPRPDLPSPMQRLMTPLRRLVLRCIRVYWVQQLAINRALLAAMRTLRRESRAESASQAAMLVQQSTETAHLREELTELATEMRALREQIATMKTASAPAARQAVLSDDEAALRRETDR